MTELQVSVEVRTVDGCSVVVLVTSDIGAVQLAPPLTYRKDADELADRWRVALRNIDGSEVEIGGHAYCLTHHRVAHGEGLLNHHRCPDRTASRTQCDLVPLFFRDIKDKGANE